MKYYIKYLDKPRGLMISDIPKCEPFSIGSAAIIAGGSLLGSIFSGIFGSDQADSNLQAVRETNSLNKYIADSTNAMNHRLAYEYNANQVELQNQMNQFNQEMWEKNNEYNSPAAVLQRASEAGINPNSAFGTNVASSPVQQTTLPDQQMPHYDPYKLSPETINKDFSFIKDIAQQISELPMVKERVDAMRLANDNMRIKNDLERYDLQEKEDERLAYNSFKVYRSTDGNSWVTADEFERMSDDDKAHYLKPTGYRHAISDKVISVDDYNKIDNPHQRDLYKPSYDGSVPELVKLPFRSAKGYEAWQKAFAAGRFMQNVSADRLQDELRAKIASKQINSSETLDALANMPAAAFNELRARIKQIHASVAHDIKVNENLSERLNNQDEILKYEVHRLRNSLDKDPISIISKYVPDGAWRDFLIGTVSFLQAAFPSTSVSFSGKIR